MMKLIAWIVFIVMAVLFVKFIFGLIAAVVPLALGVVIGVPVGYILHATKQE